MLKIHFVCLISQSWSTMKTCNNEHFNIYGTKKHNNKNKTFMVGVHSDTVLCTIFTQTNVGYCGVTNSNANKICSNYCVITHWSTQESCLIKLQHTYASSTAVHTSFAKLRVIICVYLYPQYSQQVFLEFRLWIVSSKASSASCITIRPSITHSSLLFM